MCNLDLQAMHGKFAYDFEDEAYWFCSEACREEFRGRTEEVPEERAK